MNKVLFVSYFFPPVGGGSVQRSSKFVKYLPSFGWKPIVLTVKNPDHDYFDNSLLDELSSSEIMIIRTPSINLWRYFRQKIYGKNSLYETNIKKEVRVKNIMRKIFYSFFLFFKWIINNFVFFPDEHSLWIPIAVLYGSYQIYINKIKVIYATGYPYSSFVTAMFLSHIWGIPYVIDMRDPWILSPYKTRAETKCLKFKTTRFVEYLCVKGASKVINVNEHITKAYSKYYRNFDRFKFITITHGYDDSDFESLTINKLNKFVISHVGTFYVNRKPDRLLEAINLLIEKHPDLAASLKIRFVGITGSFIERCCHYISLSNLIEMVPYCSHQKSILEMCSANLLVIIQAKLNSYKLETSTGKLFEYLASGTDILALTSKHNVIVDLITEYNRGKYVDPDDVIGISEIIYEYYEKWKKNRPSAKVLSIDKKYTRRFLAGLLAKNLDEIVQ